MSRQKESPRVRRNTTFLSLKMFQTLQPAGQTPCRHCQGAGCRDCGWFGTEDARESHERARKMVVEIRGRRLEGLGGLVAE